MTTSTAEREITFSGKVRRPRAARRNSWGNPVVYFIALCFIALMIAPVLYIILGGFRDGSQITVHPASWPNPWRISSYHAVLTNGAFWRALGNSTFAAVVTTAGTVALGLMVSFVLARYKFRGSGALHSLFAAGLMFPITVAITPLYIMLKMLHLINNMAGIILPGIAFALPVTVIILVPFLRAIPYEIQEAAEIDGCGRMGFFFRMVMPLSMPGVITTGILAFIGSWNGFILPLYIFSDPDKYTLPLAVRNMATGQYSADTALMLAATSLAMLPAIGFFSLFERRIVGGLTGAVKG